MDLRSRQRPCLQIRSHSQVPGRREFWGPPFSPVQKLLSYSGRGPGSPLQASAFLFSSRHIEPKLGFPKAAASAWVPAELKRVFLDVSVSLPWAESWTPIVWGPPLHGSFSGAFFEVLLLLFCALIQTHNSFTDGLSSYF